MTKQRPYWSERFVPPEERGEKLSLHDSLKSELARRELHFISLRRAGPFKASMAYRTPDDHVWTVDSQADSNRIWEQEALEDWLYSDMLSQVEGKISMQGITLEELGKRVVSSKRSDGTHKWEFMAGMIVGYSRNGVFTVEFTNRLTYVNKDDGPYPVMESGGPENHPAWGWPKPRPDGWIPDLSDPATLGCFKDLLRKLYCDDTLTAVWHDLGWVVVGKRVYSSFKSPTELESLVVAFEAAP